LNLILNFLSIPYLFKFNYLHLEEEGEMELLLTPRMACFVHDESAALITDPSFAHPFFH